jgi:hypothetical protein
MAIPRQGMNKEGAVETLIQARHQSHEAPHPRWDRMERAERFDPYLALQAHGLSQRQAATQREVPRRPLRAWQTSHDRLNARPTGVAFFHSPPGLAFLHRLVLGIPLVYPEGGACGIRLVCLLLPLTGLDRVVAAS